MSAIENRNELMEMFNDVSCQVFPLEIEKEYQELENYVHNFINLKKLQEKSNQDISDSSKESFKIEKALEQIDEQINVLQNKIKALASISSQLLQPIETNFNAFSTDSARVLIEYANRMIKTQAEINSKEKLKDMIKANNNDANYFGLLINGRDIQNQIPEVIRKIKTKVESLDVHEMGGYLLDGIVSSNAGYIDNIHDGLLKGIDKNTFQESLKKYVTVKMKAYESIDNYAVSIINNYKNRTYPDKIAELHTSILINILNVLSLQNGSLNFPTTSEEMAGFNETLDILIKFIDKKATLEDIERLDDLASIDSHVQLALSLNSIQGEMVNYIIQCIDYQNILPTIDLPEDGFPSR